MAIIKHGNWSFRDPHLKDGDVVDGGNFSQATPGTEICKGVKTLTIRGGNWTNVKPQATWTILGGNWAQVSRSPKAHPDWVERGVLAVDAQDPDDVAHRSAETVWQRISKSEFRAIKDAERVSLPAESAVRIAEHEDQDGVKTQEFDKLAYVYEDTLVKTGPRHLTDCGVAK